MSKQSKRMRIWNELMRTVARPPKRYKHQRDINHAAKIIKLRKAL